MDNDRADNSPTPHWPDIARATRGDDYARSFAASFDALAESGQDIHGEARLVASLAPQGTTVLDAGCGTGRVAERLASLGYDVAGADPDPEMIAVARDRAPHLEWHVAGLADMDLGREFEVIVIAGNVIPFVSRAELPASAANLAAHTSPGGLVVCGFGTDRQHLPPGAAVVPLEAYDNACARVGLVLTERFATWDRAPYDAGGYAVSIHRRD